MKDFINRNFARTGTLMKFILRRERIVSLIWIVSMVLFSVALAPMFEQIGDDPAIVNLLSEPFIVILVGPVFNTSIGGIFAAEMLLMTVITVGVMNVFFVLRHTRSDEEVGRNEVIRSFPLGRLSSQTAALSMAFILNLIIGLLTFLGLAILPMDGFTVFGALVYGLALTAGGIFFAALTAVFAQLFQNSRTASAYTFGAIGIMYLIRAIGDAAFASGHGIWRIALLSPLGLITHSRPFAHNWIWTLFILLGIAVILIVVALKFNSMRDIDQGLIPSKKGKDRAGLLYKNTFGLGFKLTIGLSIGFIVAVIALAVTYGSVMGSIDDMLAVINNMLGDGQDPITAESFVSIIILLCAVTASIPSMAIMLKLVGEEKAGRIEGILAKPVSRTKLFLGYFILSLVVGIVTVFIAFMTLWITSLIFMDDPLSFSAMARMIVTYIPVMIFMTGLAALFAGIIPGKTVIAWAYLGFCFFIGYIGGIIQLPDAAGYLSPFGYVPNFPMTNPAASIIGLIAVGIFGVIMAAIGMLAYKKRDIKFHA